MHATLLRPPSDLDRLYRTPDRALDDRIPAFGTPPVRPALPAPADRRPASRATPGLVPRPVGPAK